jgi:hypothetical protein
MLGTIFTGLVAFWLLGVVYGWWAHPHFAGPGGRDVCHQGHPTSKDLFLNAELKT